MSGPCPCVSLLTRNRALLSLFFLPSPHTLRFKTPVVPPRFSTHTRSNATTCIPCQHKLSIKPAFLFLYSVPILASARYFLQLRSHMWHLLSSQNTQASSLWLVTTITASNQLMVVYFITDLPPSKGFDTILTVMDGFTKMAQFLSCVKNINSQETADIITCEVFQYHGLPNYIISDRGPQFISPFWKYLWAGLKISCKLSLS